jgi:hypothetical protein
MYQRGELNEAEDGSYHLPVCVVYLKFAHDMNRWDDSIIGRSRMVLFFLAGARISADLVMEDTRCSVSRQA